MTKRRSASRNDKSNGEAAAFEEKRIGAVIEVELQRLQKASALLASLVFVLVYARDRTDDESNDMHGGEFADIAETARDLVRQSIRNLDTATMAGSSGAQVIPANKR